MASASQHVDRVLGAVRDKDAAARSRLAASWRRSLDHHGLDPGQKDAVQRMPEATLREHREAAQSLCRAAAPRLDALFQLVGGSGCGVLLSDARGVVLDRRIAEADHGAFGDWGLVPGADWSEACEGTNGIGTCIAEARRVIIHRDDHFFARNIALSCLDAPIFGPEGELIGALDISSARADQTEGFNRLIGAMVSQTARQIEVDSFRNAFPGSRIIIAEADDSEAAVLLAVDQNDILQGATRGARRAFGLNLSGPVTPRPASDLFGREDGDAGGEGFEKAERAAVLRALSRTGGNVSEAARLLGVARATLYRRMKRLAIS